MSASAELHDAILDRLKADAAVSAAVAGRIYDEPPTTATFPFISLGPTSWIEDDEGGIPGRVETVQIDCWDRTHGRKRPAKLIVDAVNAALHEAQVELTENALHSLRVVRAQVMDDPDGITAHGVVTVEAMVET